MRAQRRGLGAPGQRRKVGVAGRRAHRHQVLEAALWPLRSPSSDYSQLRNAPRAEVPAAVPALELPTVQKKKEARMDQGDVGLHGA